MTTLTYTKKLVKLLLADIYVELKMTNYSFADCMDPTSTDAFYLKLKARIDLFYSQYGTFYEDFVSKILLTQINIGRQYRNGANAILQIYNNELTPTASLALLTFYTLMIKSCIRRGLVDFIDSVVEWNCRVFEEHITSFENNGGWEVVSKSLDANSGCRRQRDMGFRTFTKCMIVICLGCLLIKGVAH